MGLKKTVAIIFGGQSAEHEVSLRSAKNIVQALNKELYDFCLVGISKQGTWYQYSDLAVFNNEAIVDSKKQTLGQPTALISRDGAPVLFSLLDQKQTKIDAAFPVMHGTFGEDGCIQGLFKMMNLPFVGCGVLASAIGMDKDIMKRILNQAGIPNAKSMLLTSHQTVNFDEIKQKLGLPFFIKPANAGSSVGVHKIKSAEDFATKIKDSFKYDYKVLAEEFVQGREIECSVMGMSYAPQASLPGEVIPQHEFYSYEAKYLDDNGALLKIPAELDAATIGRIQEMAKKTYSALGCDGMTRVDFFLKANGDLYINEVNTIPGFTKISMYPKMWEATGISYSDLITKLVENAFAKHAAEKELIFSL